MNALNNDQLKDEILKLTREFSRRVHRSNRPGYEEIQPKFIPGETVVPPPRKRVDGAEFSLGAVEGEVAATLEDGTGVWELC